MFERGKQSNEGAESRSAVSKDAKGASDSTQNRTAVRRSETAVIGRSIQINGDLRGNEDLRIEGDVSGTVRLENSALTIGKDGKVTAGVYAKSIVVDGETQGDLHATECVSVHANARVQGNIVAPRVSIVEGAHFKGSIEMDPEAVDKALGTKTTATKPKASSTPAATGSAVDSKTTPATPQAKSA